MLISDKKAVLLLSIIAGGMIFLDATVLPVALPRIQSMFHSSSEELQWMINSYLLSFSIFIAICGRLSDIFGHRRIFCFGMIFFGITSFLSGLSYASWQLIFFRFFQGIGAALMLPSSTALLCDRFFGKDRAKAMGVVVATNSAFMAFGPLLGGFFTEYFSWHLIFFINLPIAFLGFFIAVLYIASTPGKREPVDFLGFIFFAAGMTFFIISIMQSTSWNYHLTIGSLFIAAIFFSIFLFFERRMKTPLIDLSLFKNRIFLGTSFSIFMVSFVRMMPIFWVVFFQKILNYSPFQSGLITLASSLPMVVFAPIAGRMVIRYKVKRLILTGMFILFLSFLWISIFIKMGNIFFLIPALCTFGSGVILSMFVSYNTALGAVPQEKRGVVSGILNTFRNVSACSGVALFGAILIKVQYGDFSFFMAQNRDTKSLQPRIFEGLLSDSQKALEVLNRLSFSVKEEIVGWLKESYSSGVSVSTFLAAIFILLGFFGFLLFFKSKRRFKGENSKKF